LQGKIDFWVKHATGGKAAKVAASSFAGRIGLTCSSSCSSGGGNLNMDSFQVADAVSHQVLHYPYPTPPKHHHK
jgi:hypothetical protein